MLYSVSVVADYGKQYFFIYGRLRTAGIFFLQNFAGVTNLFVVPPRKVVLRMGVMDLEVSSSEQLAQGNLRVSKVVARLHRKI